MSEFDRAAIITGGTGGLGRCVTREFLENGWRCAVAYRDFGSFEELRNSVGCHTDHLIGCECDAASTGGLDLLRDCVLSEGLRPSALICLLGGFASGGAITETGEDVWDRMMTINAKSAFLAIKAFAPLMAQSGGGSVVTVGSRAGGPIPKGLSAYGVSKAAVVSLTQAASGELLAQNIRVNCVLPGIIDTPANRNSMPGADFSKWVRPEEVSRVIRFLASEASAPVSGAVVPVYGNS